ncbi:MAG: hypothetical protein RL131_12, partial [Bacteroidota bacterium]
NRLELIVKDNGKGLPVDWTPEKSGSMGYQIIGSFVNKLKAKLEFISNQGTEVRLAFEVKEKKIA